MSLPTTGIGNTLMGSFPFVSKCPGVVHTYQVMVFPLNLPSDNQVLMIMYYWNQHISIVACLSFLGWKKCVPSISVLFGWGSAIFFHLCFLIKQNLGERKLLNRSSGFGTINLDDALHNLHSKSALIMRSSSSFVFLQYRGLRVTFKPTRWVQHVKTLVPREWFPFWYQTQGLLAGNVAGHYLGSLLFGLISANSGLSHSFVFCPTQLAFLLSIKTQTARIILLQSIKSM